MKCSLRTAYFLTLSLAVIAATAANSLAATVTYVVDPLQSSITLSGTAFSLAYAPQVPGSLTDSWSGSLTGDLTGGILTFTGGSSITANLSPLGPFSTAPAPLPPGGDNYGVTASGNPTGPYAPLGPSTINGAYRSLELDIAAGTVTDLTAPVGMSLKFIGGSKLDYGAVTTGLGNQAGSSSLVGVTGANTTATAASLLPSQVKIPVHFQTTGSNRSETWDGVIVANLVPEPASGLLMLLGLAGLASRRERAAR